MLPIGRILEGGQSLPDLGIEFDFLNDDEAFRNQVSTAENLAVVIQDNLTPEIANCGSAELVRVKVIETRHNSCTIGALA